MTNHLEDDMRARVAHKENQDNTQTPPEDIQDISVLIVREQEADHVQIVERTTTVPMQSAATPSQHDSCLSAYLFVCLSFFLSSPCNTELSTVLHDSMIHPFIATVTIIPTSQHVTLNGTVQLGRVLPPFTISQSQTTPATGHGHQNARAATGTVTFFNGLFTQQFVARGTVYTGQDGVAIVTTQDATIPPGSPSTGYGTTTVPAHAVTAGRSGNIPAGDMNSTIKNGLLVRNTPFSGGQNARTYTTVTHHDIHSISTVLMTTLESSTTGALQGQLHPNEQLYQLPCNPTVTSDHQPGDEATQVNVTVSETCSAIAYNSQELETKAAAYLTTQAQHKTEAGYSVYGTIQVSVKQATVSSTPPHLVFLSFSASGTWIYGLSATAQQQIKQLIASKTTQEALQLLATLPGVQSAALHFSGFGEATRLPKQSKYIHLTIIVV